MPRGTVACSDGSLVIKRTGPFPFQLDKRSGAAVVLIDPDKQDRAKFLIQNALPDVKGRSFALDYMALVLAQIICEEQGIRPVYIDGNSVLQAVKIRIQRIPSESIANVYSAPRAISNSLGHTAVTTFWKMSIPQYGNVRADRVASGCTNCSSTSNLATLFQWNESFFHQLIINNNNY
jgi:hypothetical protein